MKYINNKNPIKRKPPKSTTTSRDCVEGVEVELWGDSYCPTAYNSDWYNNWSMGRDRIGDSYDR